VSNVEGIADRSEPVSAGRLAYSEQATEHRFDEIAGKAKIAPHLDVAEIQPLHRMGLPRSSSSGVSVRPSRRRGMGDLLRGEIERTTRTFMIKKYAAGQVQAVLLTIGTDGKPHFVRLARLRSAFWRARQ